MASVHRKKDSKFWHMAWRDLDGTMHMRSTKQTDRAKALKFALEIERAEQKAGSRSLTEIQAKRILDDILIRAGQEPIDAPTIKTWLSEWITSKQESKSAGTSERYKGLVECFLVYLGDKSEGLISNLTPRDIQGFITYRQKQGLASGTILLDGKILRTALNRAKRQGVIQSNPAEAIELPQRQSVERGTFTGPEVKMLIEAAKDEWKTLIALAYYTGARLSDCIKMEWSNVDLLNGTLSFVQKKIGGKPLVIPVHSELLAILDKLASSDKPEIFIMPHMASLKSGGRHGLSEGFKRIVEKAGLDLQRVEGSGVRKIARRTFHALRHSFASALANAGVAPELRMKLTGHKSAAIHAGYTHHELENLKTAINKLPAL